MGGIIGSRVVLGDSLGTLRDGVLGELSGKDQTDSSLDLSGGDGVTTVDAGKTTRLVGNALKDIVDEGVHDDHGALGDTSVGVDLTEDLVDVALVRGSVGSLALLLVDGASSGLGHGGLSATGLLVSSGGFGVCGFLGGHFRCWCLLLREVFEVLQQRDDEHNDGVWPPFMLGARPTACVLTAPFHFGMESDFWPMAS